MTSGNVWSFYVFTDGTTVQMLNWENDKREKNWNNDNKCVKWVVWMWFFQSSLDCTSVKKPVLSIIVIRLIPVRALTAQWWSCPHSTVHTRTDWAWSLSKYVPQSIYSGVLKMLILFLFLSKLASFPSKFTSAFSVLGKAPLKTDY